MGEFPITRWSLIRASEKSPEERRAALNQLLVRYLPALRHYLLKRGVLQDRVDDLLQSFMVSKVLEDNLVAKADPQKGRFRSLLLTALDRHVIDQYRRGSRLRRAGDADVQEAEQVSDRQSQRGDPFELDWARQVLDETIARMRASCDRDKRADVWAIFDARVLAPLLRDEQPLSYEQMRQRLPIRSAAVAANLLVTGKRLFARSLREVIGEYASDEQQIEEEITDLRRILARSSAAVPFGS